MHQASHEVVDARVFEQGVLIKATFEGRLSAEHNAIADFLKLWVDLLHELGLGLLRWWLSKAVHVLFMLLFELCTAILDVSILFHQLLLDLVSLVLCAVACIL